MNKDLFVDKVMELFCASVKRHQIDMTEDRSEFTARDVVHEMIELVREHRPQDLTLLQAARDEGLQEAATGMGYSVEELGNGDLIDI